MVGRNISKAKNRVGILEEMEYKTFRVPKDAHERARTERCRVYRVPAQGKKELFEREQHLPESRFRKL